MFIMPHYNGEQKKNKQKDKKKPPQKTEWAVVLSQFVKVAFCNKTVTIYNKTVAVCNKKPDAFCSKIAVTFCNNICRIL